MKLKLFLMILLFLAAAVLPSNSMAAVSIWQDISSQDSRNGLVSLKKGAETNVIASADGLVYVAFEDKYKGNRARVRMFDGNSWRDLSDGQNPNGWVSERRGGNPVLEIDGRNVYVAFMDYANQQRTHVKKWDGSVWSDLSDESHPGGLLSGMRGFEPALSFDRQNRYLYAAFRDESNGERERVLRWNTQETGWSDVSDENSPGGLVSSSVASEADIKPSKTDDGVFIAFEDRANGNRIRVRKWDGSVWSDLSDESHPGGLASPSQGYSPSINPDDLGNLYLAYTGKKNKNTYVHEWDGARWNGVGRDVVVKGRTIESTVVTDSRNYLFLSYSQKAKGAWRVRAKVWDGSEWFDVRDGKSNNISKGRGKGDPSLSTNGEKVFMSFTDARHKNRARVKSLNFNL